MGGEYDHVALFFKEKNKLYTFETFSCTGV